MKNKILIFVFTILTFGLFLVPLSFAKDVDVSQLDKVNRVYDIELNDNNNTAIFYFNASDFTFNNNMYVSLSFFNDNLSYNNDYTASNVILYYYTNANSGDLHYQNMTFSGYNWERFYYTDFHPSITNIGYCFIVYSFSNSTMYNNFKNSYQYVNLFCYQSASGYAIPFTAQFVPNSYYGVGYDKEKGAFNGYKVFLGLSGTQSLTDESQSMISYNAIKFNNLASQVASNNDRNTNQYYLRLKIDRYVKEMINVNIRYLELSSIIINGVYYDYSDARNVLPILNSNIVLYNDSATLFNTNDLPNSGYGSYYIDYIDFRIADYSFKSSTYYNPNLGISGYIDSTYITAISYNLNDYYYNGYNDGERIGYDSGYNNGYNDGVASNKTSFDGLMLSVANVPMTIISSMLNFNILGVNLLGFFMGIITLLLFVKLMRKFKE